MSVPFCEPCTSRYCAAHHTDGEPALEPCATFVSAGFGPDSDFEHRFFCSVCGFEFCDHITDDDEG